MLSGYKKYILIIIAIFIFVSTYWFFYYPHWAPVIQNKHTWKHSFQSKNVSNFNNIKWEKNLTNKIIAKNPYSENLIFHSNFEIKSPLNILEGCLEYNPKYSAKIYINNIKCADVNRHLITGDLEKNSVKIEKYWTPRKITLDQKTLRRLLKKGNNTISIVVYNVQDLNTIKTTKKQLSFLSKEYKKDFKTILKIKKPKQYFKESPLPIFKINTSNEVIPDEPKINASLDVLKENNPNRLSDPSTYYPIKIEVRGNTSQSFAKQSYGFNVYDVDSAKKSVSLLGLPASKKWVLQGPYADKSLIRNVLTYNLYRQMGNYAPKTQFVELIINNNYRGIYVLTEKIQIGKNHLNITKLKQNILDSPKETGGYLLEIDRHKWKSNYPPKHDTSARPVPYDLFSPKKEKIDTFLEQKIKHQFNLFEQHLYEGNDIFNYFDISSFIDYLIITELTKNTDGYCLSTFLYNKNINSPTPKFYIGPIWDYNLTFGLADYRDSFKPEGFVYNSSNYIPFWWKRLLANEEFRVALNNRYSKLRATSLSNTNINKTIDSLALICSEPAELNFKKWTILGGSPLWPNYYTGQTYHDEIDYIKNWTTDRLIFLDRHFKK